MIITDCNQVEIKKGDWQLIRCFLRCSAQRDSTPRFQIRFDIPKLSQGPGSDEFIFNTNQGLVSNICGYDKCTGISEILKCPVSLKCARIIDKYGTARTVLQTLQLFRYRCKITREKIESELLVLIGNYWLKPNERCNLGTASGWFCGKVWSGLMGYGTGSCSGVKRLHKKSYRKIHLYIGHASGWEEGSVLSFHNLLRTNKLGRSRLSWSKVTPNETWNWWKVPPQFNVLVCFVLILHTGSFYSGNPVVCRKQERTCSTR